jgi:hypothetical protein
MSLNAIVSFINAVNPLPRLLNLLPANVARQVAPVLATVGGLLIVANETLLTGASPELHRVIDGVLAVFVALGIHGQVTPVKDPNLPGIGQRRR